MDVSTAFNYLRPITVTVTQNHDVKSVQTLSDVLRSDVLSDDVVQQMHEYIAFPLRLLLKNYAIKDNLVCLATLECFNLLLKRIKLQSKTICLDLFKTVLDIIFLPTKRNAAVEESIKAAAISMFHALFSRSDIVCYKFIVKEALPLFGGLISTLLTTASASQSSELTQASLDCLLILLDDKTDCELRRVLATVLPSFLPGMVKHITKIITSPAPKAKVIARALKLMHGCLRISLSNSPWGHDEDIAPLPHTYFSVDTNKFMIVDKTEEWRKMATQSLPLVIKSICDVCMSYDSWLVRREAVDWSYHILVHCSSYLPDSKELLLDIITHNMGDNFTQVSQRSTEKLGEILERVEGAREMLEMRVYDIATRLPTTISRQDESESLKVLKTFNGYLSSLGPQIVYLLKCHTHLERISLALFQLLQLDCSSVNILETSAATADHELPSTEVVFPVLRRQFLLFSHKSVWEEISKCISHFTKHGEVYTLVDHFMSECQSSRRHRLQTALLINEILSYLPAFQQAGSSEEKYDVCKVVLEFYNDMYRQLECKAPKQTSIVERNESIQLLCFILEGLVAIHQVCTSEYPELLLYSLYAMLESCAHDNILIRHTAVTGLQVVSIAFNYSGKAELIEKHCNYVCNILSLNIRRLHRHPTSPSVLCSVIRYSQATILPYITQIVTEVLLSLDDNYVESCLSLLRVPQTLLRQLCFWFPSSPIQESTLNQSDADKPFNHNHSEVGVDSNYTLDIIEYVVDYYTTRMTSKYLELSDADAAAATEQHDRHEDMAAVEDLEQEEQNLQEKKNLPEHVQITKKVLDRCKHLLSHPSVKVKLVVIEMISDACTVLSTHTEQLLPSVHDIWAGLSRRFSDAEPLVVIKAINCLAVLADLSKDFIRARVSKDVLPKLVSLLTSKAAVSKRTGKAYRHTLDYKLQLMLLETVGTLCIDTKLGYSMFNEVVCSCILYLSCFQPPQLQQCARNCLILMAEVDADLVWYNLNSVVTGVSQTAHKDCMENAKAVLLEI